LEHDKKEPSYEAGRVRDASVAARQNVSGVRARLMQLLRVAARKRESVDSIDPEEVRPSPAEDDEARGR